MTKEKRGTKILAERNGEVPEYTISYCRLFKMKLKIYDSIKVVPIK